MHLSKEIQKRLDSLHSSIQLSASNDGVLPGRYSFYNKPGRTFRAGFGSSDNIVSVLLYEKTGHQNNENCAARGLFTNLNRVATVIQLWVDKLTDIIVIKKDFDELELYTDFEFINPNQDIDIAWRDLKNKFFNDTQFWKYTEWEERYFELLSEAKKHPAFADYFPFTSHYWLRFSLDKDIKETWTLDYYIVSAMYTDETPGIAGKFYVSYNDKPMGGQYFDTAKEALDFYAEKLSETKPIQWNSQ